MAPELVEARLAGQWLFSDPEYCQRAMAFLRIAAGLEDPQVADAWGKAGFIFYPVRKRTLRLNSPAFLPPPILFTTIPPFVAQ